jgi:hypothetical protein
MDGTYGYDALNSTHHYAPNKMLLGTEGCSCSGVKVILSIYYILKQGKPYKIICLKSKTTPLQ